jgi:hypothetical protein
MGATPAGWLRADGQQYDKSTTVPTSMVTIARLMIIHRRTSSVGGL